MAVRVYDAFSRDWSYDLDDTTVVSIGLTRRNASLLLQCSQYLLQREAYIETMDDSQWDELNSRVAGIIEELSTV